MSRVDRYEYKDWKGFGVRTMQYRKEIGLSKEKFSEMINRSENFVSDLEKEEQVQVFIQCIKLQKL